MKLGSLLVLPATALRATAAVLRVLAVNGERVAAVLRPLPDEHPQPRLEQAEAGLVTPPLQRPAAAEDVPSPPAQLDVARLAAQTAPQIIAALDGLGTTDLADLYDHESKHRRRRKVLDAIEAAAAPPPAAAAPTDIDLTDLTGDVREPDELVYTTETPRR